MADFGGFEIEDDEKKPSSSSAFGGFEIEDDEGWNDYIQSHWDDMGDEIRRDPGVRGERARRKREARVKESGDKAAQMATKKYENVLLGQSIAGPVYGKRELENKTTQVAPELFLTGDVLEDADGNAIKPGDAIAVYHKEGDGPFTGEAGQAARLMEFTGVNEDGKPVFKETEGVSSEGAMVAGKLHVRDEDFDRMMGKGEGKVERSPFEQIRLGALAETGDRRRYTDDMLGTAKAVYDRLMPYAGRSAPNEQRERTRHLSNIYEGKLDGYDGKTEAEKYRDAARKAGLEPWNPLESLHPDENDAEFMGRIQHDAGEELRLDAIAKLDAGGKLSETEQSVLDKIVKGGVESGGYALEFALPGGAIFKGAQALNWGAKAVRAATMLGSAVPVVATEAMSRYQENVTPEYGFDDNGEFKMVAAPDDEEEAAYKAIGGAIFDTAVEVGLEAATMGLLRGAGKASGWLLGKATPGAVREFGAKKFNKFMASETGQALRSINRAYQDFSTMTQINSPFGELAEENVQAFEKFLNLDGKTSEHKGFAKEWQDFKDNQLNWQTQWDIFYGLIAQLAIGSVKSVEQGIAQHISSTDARRDIRMALKRSGISDETISTLTPKQQKTLTDMWQRYSANPDALKDRVKNLGYSMRAAVDELTARDGLKMRQSLEQRGIAPERFTIQTGEDGKPAFQQMERFTSDGKQAPMNAMTDAAHGVTIVDQGDGTFYVMNDFRGLDAIPAYSFEEAQKKADEEVVRNQSMDADNAQKAQYLMGLVQRQYAGRNVVSIPSEAALRWQVAQAVHDGKEIFGITRADQLFKADGSLKQPGAGGFHTPDGHIVVILDNVPSPAEMERVLAHEATGHEGVEGATGRGANTVEFIQNAQAEGFSKFVLAEQQRAIQKFVAAGMDEATARMQVAAAMSTDEYAREAMARYAQGRLHQPTWYEKRKHELNQRRRDAGENVPIDQSDLEVMLAEAEKQGAQGANELETLPGDSGVRYEEGVTDEARNGADEAQPQQVDENAGRDGQQPPPQAAEGPVEVAPPRGEAPDAGVVEPSKTDNGGQNLNTEAKKPKGKRGDNLRGRSYEDYAASPDDGGTADEMGAALLRFVRDNGGLLKMPKKGVADPMADWINSFLDGNARKNNRGEFVALFGMKPKTGANDAIAEDMPSGLKEFVEGMIERDGPGAVADWFLETRRKYREWAQNRRNAAQGNAADAVERYDFDELAAAQDAMDEEFANALGVLEGADEADYAMLTPENLKIAKSGDTIRFDHDRKSFVFGSYDAENGVLVVYDEDVAGMEGGKFRRAYRVTENSIEEIEDGQGNESGADANRAGNEEGAQGGDFQLESVTAEQITAEEKKRREKAEIKKRQEAPLKGSGAVNVQPEMDLGQTGQQDLFSPIAENGNERNWDAPISDIKDAKAFLDSIGYPNLGFRGLSKVMTDGEGRKFVKYHANGVITPNIYLGETTPREIVEQLLLYGNENELNLPDSIVDQFKREQVERGALQEELDSQEIANIKDWLKSENIPFSDVIDSERGYRIAYTDRRSEGGWPMDYIDVEDLSDAKERVDEIRDRVRQATKHAPSNNRMARAKAAADRHVVVYGNGQKGTLADLIKNGGARLYPEKGLTVFDKGKPHVVTIGFQQFTPTKDELPYLVQLQKDYDAAHPDDVPPSQRKEPAKTAPASAPNAEGTITPPKSTDAPQVVKTTRDGESVRIVQNGREYEVELPDVKFPKTFTKATSKADWEAKMAEAKKIADELKKKAPFHSVINPKTGKYYANGSEIARQRQREVAAYEEAVRRAANQAFDEIGEYDDSWDEEPTNAAQGGVVEDAKTPAKPVEGRKTSDTAQPANRKRSKDEIFDGFRKAYRQFTEAYGLPLDPLLGEYRFVYKATKGYRVDELEHALEGYQQKLRDLVIEPATEKQIAFIKKLCSDAEWDIIKDAKLNKVSASYVIAVLKDEEELVNNTHAPATAETFDRYLDELRKIVASSRGETTPVAPVRESRTTEKSSQVATPRTPSFKRGDKVFLKGAAEDQRVTFLKANADGTADVQVRTPGANRYAPEKVETRTVPMGDISATGMKETLTEAERKRLEEGEREQAEPSIKMKDEAAEKLARQQEDDLAALFDTPELADEQITGKLDNEKKFLDWTKKWKLDPSKKKNQREWANRNHVNFDTQDFDPDLFQKRVGAVAKLVKTYQDNGVADFNTLATRMAERFPEKFDAMKPYLRGVWNAVAEQIGLTDISRGEAEKVYGTIEAKAKEAANGPGDNRTDGGVRAPADGGERPGGVLAGGSDRPENPNERVGGVGAGDVPGQPVGLAETGTPKEQPSGGGAAPGGDGAVADRAEHAGGEREAGGDSPAAGSEPVARVKNSASKAAEKTKVNPARSDFAMTAAVEEAILTKNTATRVRNNIAAIKLIRDLKARDYAATPAEQETLAKFVGWGGLREDVFGYELERAYDMERSGDAEAAKRFLKSRSISNPQYQLHKELRSILNDSEYESAKASASTAFYTPVEFVRILHGALRDLGVKGGRFLGPSAGTGNFASAAGQYEKPVNWQFVEKDAMTGELLKALFPNQRVTIGGFEETKFPDGFFDFAIDNVPYADVPINDRSISSRMFKIHDYFFAKTLAKLRPGGVMAFLTSTGTLDKTSPILRQFLTEHGGKIVGAVRLPNGFFSENAGTEAASDLVIVQKVDGRPDNTAFEKGVEYATTTEWVRRKGQVKKPITYNGYFQDHPEQVVGTMEVASGQFGPTLKYTMPEGGTLWDRVREAVKNALAGVDSNAMLKSATVAEPKERTPIYDEEGLRQGNVTMKDGKPFIKSGEMLEPIELPNDRTLNKELAKRFKSAKSIMDGIMSLRKAMRDVIDAQMAESETVEADMAPLWAKLNEAYDAFVKKNGTLHDKWVTPFVLLDKADGNRMLALERVVKDENGKSKIVKSDIFSKRVISRGQRATKAETPKDALVISYSETGTINVPRIAELLGVNEETAVARLKESGDAFENPQTGRLEPSWEYLSGRVRAKLAAARAAVEAGEESYRANVEALEKAQPPMVKLEDTEIKFGATWVDPECMADFMNDTLGTKNSGVKFSRNEVTGQWNVSYNRGALFNESPWGETTWSVYDFIERVLNHGSMNHFITDPVDKKKYLDERGTEANKLAAEKMHQSFAQFIMSSEKWAEPCYERYNAVMTDMVEIKLPNNVLPFRASGMSESALGKLFEGGDPNTPKKGREYQSAVISRGVLGGGSLCLAHCVGAGKTLEMQSIGILGRHLGMFKKPMYVVPNHMLEQFTNEFVEAFPNANILKMSEDDVKPGNRRAFFAQVANGDWDAIVVKHSTFSKKLGMSEAYQKDFLEAQRKDMEQIIEAMRESGDKISVDKANKMLDKLTEKIDHLANAENHDSQIVPFEELGVDQLFVDEAHNFKGLPITTSQGRTGGLSQGDSQRAVDMQMKAQYVQSLHGGDRGVVFATGTPLSNAPVVEAYVILKYLAPNKLAEQGLTHFDDFVSAFGRITSESEFSLDGKTVKERDKVSAFVNIPEMMKLFRSVVDIVNPDQLDIPRPKPKYRMIDVDMTGVQAQIMEMVAREAAIPASREDRNKYLTLTRIAKNACLSPRLLGFEDGGNKIIRAVSEIKKMYDETTADRGVQLVFTDIFNMSESTGRDALARLQNQTVHSGGNEDIYDDLAELESSGQLNDRSAPALLAPGTKYNLNEEIRDLLVAAGIPKEEIAIVQDIDKMKGDKDANKGALFAKVRAGEVRVLIGSRPRMGEGTNVQDRLAAIHLLHPGWKPAEDEQAIGRIIRYGNMYKEGQIFYYLTKGNSKIGSYETKNHQLIGGKSKLIDQVMHGDETVREIDMDESAMDRDMLMGLASGNKALMELIDVKKRVHKLELNTESTLTSARRNKDKAEANARILERRREEFEKEQENVAEWREKNDGKPFALSTPDGRTIEKVKDMADYVAAQMVKQLTKDRYDREERLVLGDFNGVEMVLTYDPYGDEKFRLAVPLLGVAREINYSGFIPEFSQNTMTAFKGKIFETVSPEFAEAYKNQLADMDRQAKKMSADADRLQKDYETMRDELIKLRHRQAELERAVTPLLIDAARNREYAIYGNWVITKTNSGYKARQDSQVEGKRDNTVEAKTVRELLPLMDQIDFAEPKRASKSTVQLAAAFARYPELKKAKPEDGVEWQHEIPPDKVDFDTPDLSPAEEAYGEAEDKTPTEKVMREVYGMTNEEIATALKAAGMEPPKHERKADATAWQQAEALLSNPTYMAKLSRAVAKFPRPLRDYEIDALNVLFRERQNVVNAAQGEVDDWKQTLDSIADGEVGAAEKKEDARKSLAAAQSGLARAKALMVETGKAKIGGASEQGRGLRANRGSLYQDDLTYAGITGEIARIVGGAERVTPEMDAKIRDLAKLFEDLDEQGLRIATERLKPLAEKVIKQTKDGLKVRKATERRAGDEAKRVTRNYEDALNQIEVGAAEVGGTLIGLSDQQYPSWGRWLKAIGEFHCFQNPDITEEEVINAILEDISPFMDGVDANQVRDALTGFGHNFKQSRYDSQRLMNDLKSQARMKRQLDWMDENNTMPPLTGMVRDEPSDVTRNLQKQVAERKKEVPDAGRDERRLKGVLDSAKTRVRNRIADLQRAIETGERIPASQRKVVEDLELRELKRQKEELQKAYDELFKTERTMTDAQRIALTEKLLAKELERALEDLDRARAGDFSKRPKRPGVESPTIDVLRDRIAQTREQIRELKKAKYEFGMTPEEIAALNARKMANREKAVARLAERIATGDLRPQKKPQPPMTPDQQKRYDELGEQMKRGRQKLAELRLEAENATVPTFWRGAGNFLRFVTTAQRALRATMDFSAVLRQAARMTLAHPAKAARAFGRAWTAARSEASLQDVNDEIMSDPTVQEAVKKYGLHLREVDATNARDVEMFHGMERNRIKLFGKEFAITDIPFFGEFMLKSERHYLTYLNAMSAEIYSSIVNDARRFPGGATPWQKKMVADMVNIWNGSAALSKERRQALQKAWVNDIFWAPQLAISRVQSAVGYDWWHPLTAKGMKNAEGGFDPVSSGERRAAAKAGLSEHMRSTIAMIAIGALIKWMFSDDDDKYNFSQADWFEKMMMLVSPKIGNTTIDLTGGESTFDKLVHQLATKSKRTGTGRLQKFGEFNGPSTWGAIGRYLQGKLSPSVSTVTALWEGKDYIGDEYGIGKMTQEMLVPLTFEDVKDQIVQNGIGKSLVTVPLTLLGAGGSTYDRKPYENAVNRFLEEKKAYDAISKDAELTQSERKELLDGMKSESPLMADSVRGDIDARIKAVNRLERKAKEIEKKGGTPTASLTNEIERQKSILLDKIRHSRRK